MGLKDRRAASRRLPALRCGDRDPWSCRHGEDETVGYREAAEHLLAHGFTPAPNIAALRAMWADSPEGRALVHTISSNWEIY